MSRELRKILLKLGTNHYPRIREELAKPEGVENIILAVIHNLSLWKIEHGWVDWENIEFTFMDLYNLGLWELTSYDEFIKRIEPVVIPEIHSVLESIRLGFRPI